MDNETKRKMIRNYFKGFGKWTIWFILIGLIVLIIGTLTNAGVVVVGILIMAAGGYGIYSGGRGKPTDEQMDEWLEEDLKELAAKSFKKLGIDESETVGDPVTIIGPVLWVASGVPSEDIVYKKGNDGVARFGIYRATIIQFTDKLMGIYQCTYNFLRNVELNTTTDEYFYKDVVSVSTKEISTNHTLPSGEKLVSAETFALKVSSGDSIEVMLTDPALEKLTGGSIPTSRAEKSIQTIRTILRDKKA